VGTEVLAGNDNLDPKCELDSSAFDDITKRDIGPELDCLKDSLRTFSKGVRTVRRGYISKKNLNIVIDKFFLDDPQTIKNGLDLLFKGDYLIFGGDQNFIKMNHIYSIVEFLREFNQAYLVPAFQEAITVPANGVKISYRRHSLYRRRVVQTTTLIAEKLYALYLKGTGQGARGISIPYVLGKLLELAENFPQDTPEHRESRERKLKSLRQFRDFRFLKKPFFGGSRGIFTDKDLLRLIQKVPELAASLYDVARMSKIDFGSDTWAKFQILNEAFEVIEKFVYYSEESEQSLFVLGDILKAAKNIPMFEKLDAVKYSKEARTIFNDVLGTEGEIFFSRDLFRILGHGKHVLKQMVVAHKIFGQFEDILRKRTTLTEDDLNEIRSFSVNSEFEQKTLDQFVRIVRETRFFPAKTVKMPDPDDDTGRTLIDVTLPLYSYDYMRTAASVGAYVAYEYIMKNVLKSFGDYDESVMDDYKMGRFKIMFMTLKFRTFLVDQGMWRDDPRKGAENVLLMSNLFQFQSDGIGDLNTNEAAEYLSLVLTASQFGTRMLEAFRKEREDANGNKYYVATDLCPATNSKGEPMVKRETGEVYVDECVKVHYFNQLMRYADTLPELRKYIQGLDQEGVYAFFKIVGEFTRDYPKKPYATKRDLLVMIGGLLNLESTLMRFDSEYVSMQGCVVPGPQGPGNYVERYCDRNPFAHDGYLGHDELKRAFKVYKDAIYGIINQDNPNALPPGGSTIGIPNDKLAESAFFYLVKHAKAPSSAQLIWFHKFVNKKDIMASRYDVSALLRYIKESNN
jgi:hypothetical protein